MSDGANLDIPSQCGGCGELSSLCPEAPHRTGLLWFDATQFQAAIVRTATPTSQRRKRGLRGEDRPRLAAHRTRLRTEWRISVTGRDEGQAGGQMDTSDRKPARVPVAWS